MSGSDIGTVLRQMHRAGFGGVRVLTRDEESFVAEVKAPLLQAATGGMYQWSPAGGLWKHGTKGLTRVGDGARDPYDFMLTARTLFDDNKSTPAVFLVAGFDEFVDKDPLIRRAFIELVRFARTRAHLIVLVGRTAQLHPEVHDEITTVAHALPTREQSAGAVQRLFERYKVSGDVDLAVEAASGLTFSRQQDAFGLALVTAKDNGETFDPSVVRGYKTREIGKKAYLKIEEPSIGFDDLIGHEYLKAWLRDRRMALTPEARNVGLPSPRGVLLVGPPGTGKSRFVEATAREWQVPWLTLDAGGLYGSLLGESEARLAEAIEIAERMAPCLLLLDEVERGFGSSGGERDGGTQERMIGKLLTWMAAKTAPVFVVMTSNFADRLPAALIRKGRVDEIFCLDMPSSAEREAVFRHYLARAAGNTVTETDLVMLATGTQGWVPSEIEAAVNAARFTAFAAKRAVAMFDLVPEVEKTVPVSKSMEAQVAHMRLWASHFARQTSYEVEEEEVGERVMRA